MDKRVMHNDGRLGTLLPGHSLESRFYWVAVQSAEGDRDVRKDMLRVVGPVEWELRHVEMARGWWPLGLGSPEARYLVGGAFCRTWADEAGVFSEAIEAAEALGL